MLNQTLNPIAMLGQNSSVTHSLWDRLPMLITLQNKELQYTAVSSLVSDLCGFKNSEAMLGLSNADLPCEVSEYADLFDQQNREVIAAKKKKQYFSILGPYADGKLRVLLYDRIPTISKEGEVDGIFIHSMELTQNHFQQISQTLISTDSYYKLSDAVGHCYEIIEENESSPFSKRESECLFYTLRGKTSGEIGRLLNISPKTVEFHQATLKSKLNVHSKSQLIDKAISLGYLFLLPKSIL